MNNFTQSKPYVLFRYYGCDSVIPVVIPSKLESRPGAPEALRPSRPRSWLVFESTFHNLSEEKKILKIGLKLAEIEAKMHPATF